MKTQPHIILKLIVVCLLSISCYAQKTVKTTNSNSTNKPSKIVKKLDKKKLEKYKKNKFKYTENDSIFILEDQGENYKEIKNKVGDHLTIVNVYNKQKLLLVGKGNFMFDFPIGTHTDYDLKGNITKKKNFDKDFPFSFQQLKQKLLQEYSINVDDINFDLDIRRGLDTSDMKYEYTVLVYKKGRVYYRCLLIDGKTGKTIKDINTKILD
jgi:hypothetical protein